MRMRVNCRSGRAIHGLFGALVGSALVVTIAFALGGRLNRERERTAQVLTEAQRQQEFAEANSRRQIELQAKAKDAEAEIAIAMKHAKEAKEQAERARRELDEQKAQLKELELRQEKDLEDLERRQFEPAPRVPPTIPKGKVTAITDNLALINLGTETGIAEGAILQVYRLEPMPKYLGLLEISRAEKRRSVGEFKPASKDISIQIGDIVDSKIR